MGTYYVIKADARNKSISTTLWLACAGFVKGGELVSLKAKDLTIWSALFQLFMIIAIAPQKNLKYSVPTYFAVLKIALGYV